MHTTFLLTRPSRGATHRWQLNVSPVLNFYSHAPRGARHPAVFLRQQLNNFYSHAPRGARRSARISLDWRFTFLLTRPSRGATGKQLVVDVVLNNFYSHAPRGARPTLLPSVRREKDFYSHAPRGARQGTTPRSGSSSSFLLTRPSRGATARSDLSPRGAEISTHTPLAGRDNPRRENRK